MDNVSTAMMVAAIVILVLVFVRGLLCVADAIVDIILGKW